MSLRCTENAIARDYILNLSKTKQCYTINNICNREIASIGIAILSILNDKPYHLFWEKKARCRF
jgi:hypothetical protein